MKRCSGDGGTALVEAAIITPVFFLLLFGVLEFGGLMRDYLTLNNATAGGARAAAIAGNDANADYQILQAIKKESAAVPQSQIQRIVVYHAQDATTAVPSGCKAGTASTGSGSPSYTLACNVYTGASFNLDEAMYFSHCSATTPAPSPQRFWCPTVRKYAAKADNGNGPPDWLGIYMEVRHPFITGLFGNAITLNNTTVVRLEPSSLL